MDPRRNHLHQPGHGTFERRRYRGHHWYRSRRCDLGLVRRHGGRIVRIDGASQISAESPAVGLTGAVYVVVSGDGGTSETSDATTFAFEDSESTVDDTESRAAAVCCCTAFNVPTGRSGCTSDGNKVGEKFRMEADFGSSDPGCTCSCCEYRQYVHGSFSVNDRPVRHLFPIRLAGPRFP